MRCGVRFDFPYLILQLKCSQCGRLQPEFQPWIHSQHSKTLHYLAGIGKGCASEPDLSECNFSHWRTYSYRAGSHSQIDKAPVVLLSHQILSHAYSSAAAFLVQ